MKVIFIVNGTPVEIAGRKTDSLFTLVNKALKESHNEGRPFSDWELKTMEGKPVELNNSLQGYANHELSLSLKAGYGG